MGMGFPLLKVPGISQKKTWEIWYWNAIGASKCRFYFIRSLCPWPIWCIITATAWNLDVFGWTIHGCKWWCRKNISKIVKLKTNFPTKKSPIGEQKFVKWWTTVILVSEHFVGALQNMVGAFRTHNLQPHFCSIDFYDLTRPVVLFTHHPYKKSEC